VGEPTKVVATSKTKAFDKCIVKTAPVWAFGADAAKGPHEMVLELVGYGWIDDGDDDDN
jgi:hypothetical protein